MEKMKSEIEILQKILEPKIALRSNCPHNFHKMNLNPSRKVQLDSSR